MAITPSQKPPAFTAQKLREHINSIADEIEEGIDTQLQTLMQVKPFARFYNVELKYNGCLYTLSPIHEQALATEIRTRYVKAGWNNVTFTDTKANIIR